MAHNKIEHDEHNKQVDDIVVRVMEKVHASDSARAVIEELVARDESDLATLKGWLRDEIDNDTKLQVAREKSMKSLTHVGRILADNDHEEKLSVERLTLLATIAETESRITLNRKELQRIDLLNQPAPQAKAKTTCLV